ncbi:TetR/AcrR family transcriptional regulator [Terriglobus tenax]|uniref:TetR/AcrR family transcriptional regulator n=1 Tax=Terriglobus tenax TaxID=1111115 RepID=UPI0021E0AA72|nr:TetR family transcriptional regulator [Terriglobus tenax]
MKDSGNHRSDRIPAPKQARAFKTRAELLQAARTVFAKSGFEHARLEDIARLAGKTRGAIYANFKDKEDIFFAIFEESLEEDSNLLRDTLKHCTSMMERLKAFSKHLAECVNDREAALLHIEFKTYAVRHPKRKRLAALHSRMIEQYVAREVADFIPQLQNTTTRKVISGLLDGFALNYQFDTNPISLVMLTEIIFVLLQQIVSS